MSLPAELRKIQDAMRGHAVDYGLDFFEVVFELLDWKQINEVAAYGGFPNRYPHWRFGMEYERLSKSYAYGLSKIYEMVINNDPCYAYLLHSNHIVDQKMVIAHVYGHSDFFKCNQYFAHTNRKMMDEMANHRTKVMRHVDRYGYERVESFIDTCLALENLVDLHAAAIKRNRPPVTHEDDEDRTPVHKLGGNIRPYMERYINPPEFLEAQRQRADAERTQSKAFPEHPERDVLNFLLTVAPLENWERDILSIIREEALYYAPQGQTKVMNEGWACVTGDTRVVTDYGALPARDIAEQRLPVRVFDGAQWKKVTDWACFPQRKTIRVTTRRGLQIEGSTTHQVLVNAQSETWKRLDACVIGETVALSPGNTAWPTVYQPIAWRDSTQCLVDSSAAQTREEQAGKLAAGEANCAVVNRSAKRLPSWLPSPHPSADYGNHQALRAVPGTNAAVICYPAQAEHSRPPIRVPAWMNEQLGAFLGYLIGDGHISRKKRVLGLTTGDAESRDHFCNLAVALFGLDPVVKKDGNRWRVLIHSEHLADFLQSLGCTSGVSARRKDIPELLWRSPKSVVCAFLCAYFDCDGYAGQQGVILSTFSEALARNTQRLLLQLGILSRCRSAGEGWHVHVTGQSALRYHEEIGFRIHRKVKRLEQYLVGHQQWHQEQWEDTIARIDVGMQDVYDFTVEDSHRYVAHGFINHNSYWHSTIMTKKALKDSEVIDYADHHSGTVAMGPNNFNPYKVGLELLRDIEERWNKGQFGKEYDECTDMRERAHWDRQLGLGRDKIFEVRRVYNDVTFIDTFLTPEFCQRHKLFVYAYNIGNDQFEIAGRAFEQIKKQLLTQLTNAGNPIINVVDANYQNRGELVLKHAHEGVDLRVDYARECLKALHRLWKRPVHVDTICEGVPKLLSYDGEQYREGRP